MQKTVSFISLGCAKNQIDCEQMMYLMEQAGWEIRPDPEDVDLVIVNTCGFIDAAKSEAIDHILAVGQKRRRAWSESFLLPAVWPSAISRRS